MYLVSRSNKFRLIQIRGVTEGRASGKIITHKDMKHSQFHASIQRSEREQANDVVALQLHQDLARRLLLGHLVGCDILFERKPQ